jgi:hypothetical protein
MARVREIDAFLLLQGAPAEVSVEIVSECGGERRAQAQATRRDGEVGDASRAGPHAVGEDLCAPRGQPVDPGEHDVEEDGALQKEIELVGHRPIVPVISMNG